MKDKIQLAAAALLVIAGVVLFSVLSEKPTIARLGAMFGCFIVAGALAWYTELGREFVQYAKESIEEARKVVWPTRKETMQSTGVIFVFVFVMAIFLWVVDWGLTFGVTKIIGGA
jgi:preprotein translocase subunit SecE